MRGDEDNLFIGFDETNNRFVMGTDDNITNGISGSTTSSFAQNITPGTLKVNITGDVTGDVEGNVTGTVSSLSNHDTGDLSEGSNLYHTEARAVKCYQCYRFWW